MLIQINKPNPESAKKLALFNLGFQPFFLGASIFALISMPIWMLVYFSNCIYKRSEYFYQPVACP